VAPAASAQSEQAGTLKVSVSGISAAVGQRGRRTIGKRDRVRFDLEENERGICAINVEALEQAAA
jgi:hypothetical protein